MIPTPFRFHPQENPDEPPKHLQKLHDENAALQVVEVVQMRRELEAPGAAQQEVDENGAIVHLLGVEMRVSAEAPRVLGVVAFLAGGEEGEVPVFGDVPVEGVEGVEKDEYEPEGFGQRFGDRFGREGYHSRKRPVSLMPILLGS